MGIDKVINQLAKDKGLSPNEILDEIQNAIDATWESPNGAEKRAKLFPEGKPSPELFLMRLALMTENYKQNTL